ncbi:MAG: CPBP family intramembrane metalloprotease [Deltaproteobacteria bacterium]|nr:CPBP family intramembrane metalloprotease [Deltaproteobacteria bacterium]
MSSRESPFQKNTTQIAMPSTSSALVQTDAAAIEAREALLATGLLLFLLMVLKWLGSIFSLVQEGVFVFAIGFQLYVPQVLLARRRQRPEEVGIHLHGVLLGPLAAWRKRRVMRKRSLTPSQRSRAQSGLELWLASWARHAELNGPALKKELWRVALVSSFFFPLFAVGHHLWQQMTAGRVYHFRMPDDLVELVVVNLLLVAVAEEVFYRGYLERRLDRIWPRGWTFLGIPLRRSVFVASALFALGHYLGEWNVARLAPFFPAFVFSGLVRQGGSLLGAILFHGFSNIFSAVLLAGYTGA